MIIGGERDIILLELSGISETGGCRNETSWLVAQAVSEILPDGDKEKQLLQGLLNQRDGIVDAAREAESLYD